MQGSSDFTYKLYFLFFGVPLAALGIGFAFGLIAWRIRHRKAFPFLCVVLAFVLGYLFLLNEPTMIQPAIIAFLIGGALAIRRASHQQEREKEARATRLPR